MSQIGPVGISSDAEAITLRSTSDVYGAGKRITLALERSECGIRSVTMSMARPK